MITKLFSICIAGLILAQSFNFHLEDVFKLNELVEHAQLHKDKYGDDIFTFLSKHYGELKENHREDHQKESDGQDSLPFQHHGSIDMLTVFVLHKINYVIDNSALIIYRTSNFFYQENYSSFEKYDIFQPPRQA